MAVRRQQSAIPVRQRGQRRMLLVFLGGLLYVAVVVVLLFGSYSLYRQFQHQALLPLHRIVLAKPLRYGDAAAVKQVVQEAASDDLLKIDVQAVAKRLAEVGWIERVEVEKHWLDALYIDIVERVPVARWGKDVYLDRNAVRFHLSHPPTEPLFLLAGPDGYEKMALDYYRIFAPWLMGQQVPMSGLFLDDRLSWHIMLPNGVDVLLGRDDLANRLKKLAVVYHRVIEKYQAYIRLVDLRYQDGFSVRWKAGYQPVGMDSNKP